MAWEGGFRNVLVENDCSKVLELIQGAVSDEHPDVTLILEIQSTLEREWEMELLHCCREANRVADRFARIAWDMTVDFLVLHREPAEVKRLLIDDVVNQNFCTDLVG